MAASDWSQSITWVLVIVGWTIVNRQNNARELRKEQRAAIDAIKKQLAELEAEAERFHCAEVFDRALLRQLQFKIHRVADACTRLQLPDSACTVPPVAALRQAITLKNADPTSFGKQPPTSALLDEIYACADDLTDAIEARFAARYLTPRASIIDRICGVDDSA